MTQRFPLQPVHQVSPPPGDADATWQEANEALQTTHNNFMKIARYLERAIKDGGLIADGIITEDMLSAAVKALVGDVTGTIGSSGSTTVERIQGKDVAEPTAGEDGYLLQYDDGGSTIAWQSLAAVLAVILTTSGDLLYRSGGVVQRLGVGSAYSVLAVNAGGTAPAYAGLSALLDAVFGNTQGSVLYRGAAAWAALTPGTADQVLTTNGAGADPTWEDAGGGGGTPPADFDLLTDGVDSLVFAGGDVVWIV